MVERGPPFRAHNLLLVLAILFVITTGVEIVCVKLVDTLYAKKLGDVLLLIENIGSQAAKPTKPGAVLGVGVGVGVLVGVIVFVGV